MRILRISVVAALLGLFASLATAAPSVLTTRQPLNSAKNFDWICQDAAGTLVAGSARQEKASEACVNRALAEPGKAFTVLSGALFTIVGKLDVVVPPPPPPPSTCTTPKPVDEAQTVACVAPLVGSWTQTRTYTPTAYPTCWAAAPWIPSTAPAGSCTTPTPPPPPPPPVAGDFAARCAAPGVLKCIGFDTQAEVNRGITEAAYDSATVSNPAAVPNNQIGGNYYPGFDTTGPKASGAGALRLTVNNIPVANQSGHWTFGAVGPEPWGSPAPFGANEEFWVQYRVFFSPEYAAINWATAGGAGSGGNKNSIIYAAKSCGDLEISTQDVYARGYFSNYANCGGQNMYQCPTGVSGSSCLSYNTGTYAPFALGRPFDNHLYAYGPTLADFWCVRDRESDADCPYFRNKAGAWWTFTYHVTVKPPGVLGSKVETWVSRGNGEPQRKITDFTFPWNYVAGTGFQNIRFTQYMTDKRAGSSHPVVHLWYDEFILSTQPIAAPK